MKRPFVIGLTGSIGMGKSTTAEMFAQEGIPVWSADDAVHRLYGPGGAAVETIRALHPEAVKQGTVDRKALKAWVARDESALDTIESIVHPLVAQDRAKFLRQCTSDIALLDIPLLLETGAENQVDSVIVVSVPEDEQRRRVLARGTMDAATLNTILTRQLPDAEKRRRADYVIDTTSLDTARRGVQRVLHDIREKQRHA